MGQSAKGKKCSDERLKELYELYIRRHDRINNWDLVDLAAYYVVGKYLSDKPRDVLYELARSKNMWERRTAILATAHFILKQEQIEDTFKIAELLVNDKEDLVHKGTGWMLRSAGDIDRTAVCVPRQTCSHDAESPAALFDRKLDKPLREHYLNLKKRSQIE